MTDSCCIMKRTTERWDWVSGRVSFCFSLRYKTAASPSNIFLLFFLNAARVAGIITGCCAPVQTVSRCHLCRNIYEWDTFYLAAAQCFWFEYKTHSGHRDNESLSWCRETRAAMTSSVGRRWVNISVFEWNRCVINLDVRTELDPS